jgi:hypothetical protein
MNKGVSCELREPFPTPRLSVRAANAAVQHRGLRDLVLLPFAGRGRPEVWNPRIPTHAEKRRGFPRIAKEQEGRAPYGIEDESKSKIALIPAGTGFAHHAERRRTREQDLADQLKELEAKTAAAEAEAIEESRSETQSETEDQAEESPTA